VDVSLGGDFLMTVPLPTVAPGGTVALGLGVEQRLKVARNASYREESAGLLSGELALTHEVRIRVQSHLAEPARVEVRERIPYLEEEQKDEKVKVTVKRADPPWTPYTQEERGGPPLKGGYRWQLDVPPGQFREAQVSYVITLPARKQLVGGNRREEG
jgi:hypothetical protein